jgi:hypothetical protein
MRITRKAVLAGAICVGVLGAGAASASAGEITGNGRLKPVNGKSECAFSGRNDGYFDGTEPGVRVQSFGQIVRFAGPLGGIPGQACNPTAPPPPPEP